MPTSTLERDSGLLWHPYGPLDAGAHFSVTGADGPYVELRDASGSTGYDSVKWPRHDGFIWPHPRLTDGVAAATTGPTRIWKNLLVRQNGAITSESRVELFATIRRDACTRQAVNK